MSTATATQPKDQQPKDQQHEVVYEMFIPFLYRGKDKDSTERRVFWVFKQLNWGYISQVQVFGFEDDTKKNVTARISYTRINHKADELIAQLDAGETAQVHYEQGKPWFWNVVKYTRREPKAPKAAVEPQVTFKIKVKPAVTSDKPAVTSDKPRPHTPPMPEFKPVVKPSSNKFKVLGTLAGATSESEGEETQ
jgi:hypothetical protein